MSAKLKPCPFCSSTKIVISQYKSEMTVSCEDCGAMKKIQAISKNKAAAAWNLRPTISNKSILTFEFDTPVVREGFAAWLANSGEQDYFEYMEVVRDKDNIMVVSFDFHGPNPKKPMFLVDNTVRTTSGRVTEEDEEE